MSFQIHLNGLHLIQLKLKSFCAAVCWSLILRLFYSQFRIIIIFLFALHFSYAVSSSYALVLREQEREGNEERKRATTKEELRQAHLSILDTYVLCYFRINCLVVLPNTRARVCVCVYVCTWVRLLQHRFFLLLFKQP